MTPSPLSVNIVSARPFKIESFTPSLSALTKTAQSTLASSNPLNKLIKIEKSPELVPKTEPSEAIKFDKLMGEPFVKIKVQNLGNFRAQPLEVYDQALMHKDEEPEDLLKAGIDRGYSRYVNQRGETEWKECEILEYLPMEKKFIIRWKHDGHIKKVTRLNLRYDVESEVIFEDRIKNTVDNRYKNLYINSYKSKFE